MKPVNEWWGLRRLTRRELSQMVAGALTLSAFVLMFIVGHTVASKDGKTISPKILHSIYTNHGTAVGLVIPTAFVLAFVCFAVSLLLIAAAYIAAAAQTLVATLMSVTAYCAAEAQANWSDGQWTSLMYGCIVALIVVELTIIGWRIARRFRR